MFYFKFSFWAAFIGGTEMHFSSSGSVTSCVKSNCLVKEHVYIGFIWKIYCVCVSAQPNQMDSVFFSPVSLCEFIVPESALAERKAFFIYIYIVQIHPCFTF